MASNNTAYAGANSQYYDWIELYNSTGNNFDLANYYITDTYTNLQKFKFTSSTGQVVIPANGYLIIWASGDITLGNKHTNFSLSASGEKIALTSPDGITVIDSLTFSAQRTDVSYGRLPNGGGSFKYFSPSSPNSTNLSANAFDSFLTPPIFSVTNGFFSTPFTLQLSHPDPSVTIYYTLDGSEPVNNTLIKNYGYKENYQLAPNDPPTAMQYREYYSNVYTNPISITDKSNQPNELAYIPSSAVDYNYYFPNSLIYKGNIVRAVAFKAGALPSEIITHSYFHSPSNSNKFTFPLVSIVGPEKEIFGYTNGLYVPGYGFEVEGTPNYEKTLEKRVNFEYFNSNSAGLNQQVGLRIHGGNTRAFPLKSVRLYGDNNFNFSFFNSKPDVRHRRIILRNSGNDWSKTYFRDAFFQSLISHLKMDTQASQPTIMMLNGEYWGIHNLRERYDKYYINNVYGVNADSLDMLEVEPVNQVVSDEGDLIHYNSMANFISNNNLSSETNYNTVKNLLDIENYTDYMIAEVFCANLDWPYNNVAMWRKRTSTTSSNLNPNDGRWRYLLKDTDYGLGFDGTPSNHNSFNAAPPFLSKLSQNYNFKIQFVNRFADLLNTAFLTSRTNTVLNEFKTKYQAEIQQHIARWNIPYNFNFWESEVNTIQTFITERPAHQREQIRSYFSLSGDDYQLNLQVENITHGYIKVNTINILPTTPGITNATNWTGTYYDNLPIKIHAIPKSGYKFKHWVYNSTLLTDSVLTISPNSNISYLAVFEQLILSSNPTPTAKVINTNCGFSFKSWASNSVGYPANMAFVYLNAPEPTINATIEGFTTGIYSFTSKTRINGLGNLGVSFINTSSDPINVGYPNTRLGGALLALNTLGVSKANLTWKGRTITANPKKYRIRLQYRIGDILPFSDMLDSNNQPIEYISGSAGDSTIFTITIPQTLLSQPYIQFFWKYYYTGVGASGARDQLAIDDISVSTELNITESSLAGNFVQSAGVITSISDISLSSSMQYTAGKVITLLPGFKANNNNVFEAKILTCD